jgi:hypothetical protein
MSNHSQPYTTIYNLITRTQVKTLHKQQTAHIQNNTQTNLDLRNTTLGYSLHFQYSNSRLLPIKIFAHDSGHTLVCTEYGYLKGISKLQQLKKQSAATAIITLLILAHTKITSQWTSLSYQTTGDCEDTCQMTCLPDS